jgi:hypothetical protein
MTFEPVRYFSPLHALPHRGMAIVQGRTRSASVFRQLTGGAEFDAPGEFMINVRIAKTGRNKRRAR